jgi:hypothetical protein
MRCQAVWLIRQATGDWNEVAALQIRADAGGLIGLQQNANFTAIVPARHRARRHRARPTSGIATGHSRSSVRRRDPYPERTGHGQLSDR